MVQVAVMSGKMSVARILLDYGSDIYYEDQKGL